MIILPAIDLKNGICVRLEKGNFDTVHQVSTSPIETGHTFAKLGAQWIHMVDLDGALNGQRKNADLVQQTIARSGLQIELGGGIRTLEDIEQALALGVSRVVIGSSAVTNPSLVADAVARFGEQIAVGIDALGDTVRIAGWTKDTGLDYRQFASRMAEAGVKYFIFTDIETDGMLAGPSFHKLEKLQAITNANIIASGGVTTNEDVRILTSMGLYGAIVGKAYYAETIDLALAIREALIC